MIDDIDGVYRTETMISLEESINDKKLDAYHIFKTCNILERYIIDNLLVLRLFF
jgi:hypothetical protein